MASTPKRVISAYIPHGGGPLPLLGDKRHQNMVTWLKSFQSKYLPNKPESCLVISAHWEAKRLTAQTGDTSDLYYDYYGFPEESYHIDYPLKPAKNLSVRVTQLLKLKNIPLELDSKRGFDHGVFVPLKILFPDADIPVIQLSLVQGLDPDLHIKIGEALAPLRDEGVFILGSGMSYHNMRGFGKANTDTEEFHQYLRDNLTGNKSYNEKAASLVGWKQAPKARDCHPREEHLIPLMSVFGTSKNHEGSAKEVFFEPVAGVKCAGYIFE